MNNSTINAHKQWFDDAPNLDLTRSAVLAEWNDFASKMPILCESDFDWVTCKPQDSDRHLFYVQTVGKDALGMIVFMHYLVSNITEKTPSEITDRINENFDAIEYAFKHVHALFAHELKTSPLPETHASTSSEDPAVEKARSKGKGRVTFALAPAAPIGKVNKGKLEDGRNLKANSKIKANNHRSADDNNDKHDKAGLNGKQDDAIGKPMTRLITR